MKVFDFVFEVGAIFINPTPWRQTGEIIVICPRCHHVINLFYLGYVQDGKLRQCPSCLVTYKITKVIAAWRNTKEAYEFDNVDAKF